MVAGATLLALLLRRFRLARFGAAVQVAAILVGWGLAMDGIALLPDARLQGAAASAGYGSISGSRSTCAASATRLM